MASPNVEGTSNPTATGGNTMGVVVGSKATETVGFFGNNGSVQIAGSTITTVAGLVAALQSYGLLG